MIKYTRAVAVDCETTGLDHHRGDRPFLVVLYSDHPQQRPWLCWLDDDRVSYPGEPGKELEYVPGLSARQEVMEVLRNPDIWKAYWNLSFDWQMMREAGLGIPCWPYVELRSAMSMLDESAFPFRLKQCAAAYLKEDTSSEERTKLWLAANKGWFKAQHGREPNYSDVPKNLMAEYCADDGKYTIKFFYLLEGGLRRENMWEQFLTECRLIPVLVSMQDAGAPVNVPYLQEQQTLAGGMIKYQYRKLAEEIGSVPNINSSKQVSDLMYNRLGLKCEDFTDGGAPSSGKVALKRHARTSPVVARLKRVRQLEGVIKQAQTIIEAVKPDGRVHCNVNPNGARTGRTSTNDPNMQNLTREGTVKGFSIRTGITSDPGWRTFHSDYKQIEMVDFADYSGDPVMCGAFIRGEDVHRAISIRILKVLGRENPNPTKEERQAAKTCSFAIVYGSGNKTFMETLNLEDSIERLFTLGEAAQIRMAYLAGFEGVQILRSKVGMQIAEFGRVTDRFGRVHRLGSDVSYKAINWLVQGGCSTLMKRALIRMHACQEWWNEAFGRTVVQMFLTVHDEVVFRVRADLEEADIHKIVNCMCAAMTADHALYSIPLRVDVEEEVGDWGHLKDFEIAKELPRDHPSVMWSAEKVSDATVVHRWWKN